MTILDHNKGRCHEIWFNDGLEKSLGFPFSGYRGFYLRFSRYRACQHFLRQWRLESISMSLETSGKRSVDDRGRTWEIDGASTCFRSESELGDTTV